MINAILIVTIKTISLIIIILILITYNSYISNHKELKYAIKNARTNAKPVNYILISVSLVNNLHHLQFYTYYNLKVNYLLSSKGKCFLQYCPTYYY
jgi:hypothetical protein